MSRPYPTPKCMQMLLFSETSRLDFWNIFLQHNPGMLPFPRNTYNKVVQWRWNFTVSANSNPAHNLLKLAVIASAKLLWLQQLVAMAAQLWCHRLGLTKLCHNGCQCFMTSNLCISVTWALTCEFHTFCMYTPEIINMHNGVCGNPLAIESNLAPTHLCNSLFPISPRPHLEFDDDTLSVLTAVWLSFANHPRWLRSCIIQAEVLSIFPVKKSRHVNWQKLSGAYSGL